LFTNPVLWIAICISLALQVAVVYIPFLNDAFDTTAIDATDWLLCIGLASVVLWTDELRKLVTRWRTDAAGHPGAPEPASDARC
ncbi:cation-translocating P-type ATPase C-terminal domain-containing protein, partial [Gordonia sp. UBA5067]|uniref:cation-translocating P-type ATPase C-terminal domain-containing protein n=1 Tax=Gordonia sp. UBA5067 TaxID=1946575 RepID=UPI0025BC1214